jgi:predicted Zn-dependent protease
MSANIQIPKTNDNELFENQTRTLFARILREPNLKKVGTSGQSQGGIDLVGRRKSDGSKSWVGIQCKQTGKDKLAKSTVRTEANKALKVKPPLKELLIVTQAKDCSELDEEARLFTEEQEQLGREFEVHIFGWDQITNLIQENAYPDVLQIFGVGNEQQSEPVIRAIQEGNEQLSSQMDAIQKQFAGLTQGSSTTTLYNNAFSTEGLNTVLDKQIDSFRNLIDRGQVNTAKEFLEQLWNDLPDDADGRIKYRVKANIGACFLRLDMEDEAANSYIEAYNYAPEAPKADAHKVLHYILNQEYEEALAFGKSRLKETKDLESLVSNTICSLKFLEKKKRDIGFIPAELQDNKNILISLTDLYRSLSNDYKDLWRETARKAYQLYPEEKIIQRFYAEAILDENFEEWDNKRGAISLLNVAQKIEPALDILQKRWEEARSSDTAGDAEYLSIAANLSNGYRFVDNHEKAIEILNEALSKSPDDQDLMENRLRIAFETNDGATVRQYIDRVPINRDLILGELQILSNERNWQQAYELELPEDSAGFNEYDSSFFESIKFLAGYKSGNIKNPKDQIEKLFKKFPDQAVVPLVAYQVADDLKDIEWCDELYELAKSLQANMPNSQRSMLAEISEYRGDFQNIIDILQGHIIENVDSVALRLLAVSYANTPITDQAVSFAANMSEDLLANDFYARIKGSIHYNHGDLDAAKGAFETAISISKHEVSAQMGLIRTLLRLDKTKQIEHQLKNLDLERLVGPGYLKMAIAQLQLKHGDAEKGLKYGYEVALSDQSNEQVSLFYIGMILPNSKAIDLPSPGDVVTDDCWLILEDAQGNTQDFIISPDIDQSQFNHYLPDHEISKILIGEKLGEKVSQVPLAGTGNSFKILQIKNRYVGFLHYTMDSFSTRFAGSKKLYSYTTQEGDVQPILDDIKKWSEKDDQVYNLYVEQKLPLSFLSGFGRGNVIEFANRLVNQGHLINTCIGTHQERHNGLSLCLSDDYEGVVLDTYTLWLSHAYGLLPILKEKFCRVVVAQSSIDELMEWRQSYEERDDEPLFTIGYKDGEYIRQEIAPECIQSAYQTLNDAIQYIKENIEILPAAPLSNFGKLEEEIRLSPNGNYIFDPVYIAKKEEMLLLSDDMSYRTIAKQISGVEGVWLQAVLLSCYDHNQIDLDTYSQALHALAQQRHSHLSLSSQNLLSLCAEDDLKKYEDTLFFIGTATADVPSHIKVANDFLKILWNSKLPNLTKSKASGLMLERVSKMMAVHNKELETLTALHNNNSHSLIRDYIRGWVLGHYFIQI